MSWQTLFSSSNAETGTKKYSLPLNLNIMSCFLAICRDDYSVELEGVTHWPASLDSRQLHDNLLGVLSSSDHLAPGNAPWFCNTSRQWLTNCIHYATCRQGEIRIHSFPPQKIFSLESLLRNTLKKPFFILRIIKNSNTNYLRHRKPRCAVRVDCLILWSKWRPPYLSHS